MTAFRRWMIFCLVFFCVQVATGPVDAAAITRPELVRMENVARSYWPQSRCAGSEHVYYVWLGSDTAGLAGWPGAAPCDVAVNVFLLADDRAQICLTIAHEFGHLALGGTEAQDHAYGGVMAAYPVGVPGRCHIYV